MTSNSTFLIIAGVGVALLALLLLLGSGSDTVPAPEAAISESVVSRAAPAAIMASPANSVPVVHAGLDRTVDERETFALSGEGYDPSGLPVNFRWTARGGLGFFADPTSPTTSFTAPSACDCDDTVILTLTATSASGLSVSDDMVVSVRDPVACPQTTCDTGGSFEIISVAECPDDLAPVCPATPSEPCDTPCMPEVLPDFGCPEPPVACPCKDTEDCADPWQTGWPFDDQPGHPKDRAKPSIDRQFPREMKEESAVVLHGTIYNPSCQSVCYVWSASKGWLEDAHTLSPTYHAPESDRLDNERVTITLTVYDTAEGRSYDQIRIKILNTDPG